MATKILHIPYGAAAGEPAEPITCRNGWQDNDGYEKAFFSAVWDDKSLTVRFLTEDAPIVCRTFADQGPVSDDSCVEVFLRPCEGGEYWNLEFNIAGYINASHRLLRSEKTPLTADECASIVRKANPQLSAPAEGTETCGWTLEVNIPWEIIGVEPRKGLRISGNFYACAGKAPKPYYLSWAPIATGKPDFHRPEFFGDIILD